MTINSNNYEEFFLLYVDNELEAAQRAEVEAFAAAHPGLQGELNALLQTKLSSAEEISFEGKALLYKQEMPGLITADNYETFFLLYADNELPAAQRAAVERFIEEHPAKKQEWVLLQHTRLQADESIMCPDKESLYNIGKKPSRIIPFAWVRAAVAAAAPPRSGHRRRARRRRRAGHRAGPRAARCALPVRRAGRLHHRHYLELRLLLRLAAGALK